ncbi:hypothetical protein PInf_027848 [Phytophthora infestans]|nr:hypothetical protein PInf_027848 [Phytophthora infestans]
MTGESPFAGSDSADQRLITMTRSMGQPSNLKMIMGQNKKSESVDASERRGGYEERIEDAELSDTNIVELPGEVEELTLHVGRMGLPRSKVTIMIEMKKNHGVAQGSVHLFPESEYAINKVGSSIPLLSRLTISSARMERPVFANLPPAQQDALTKLMSLLGPEGGAYLASQGPEAVTARLESFSRYENALLEHVQEKMSAATAAASMTREESMRLKPLMVSVKTFEGKDGENTFFWTREVEMVMGSALIQSEHQRVALAISRLGGRAREWTLTAAPLLTLHFPFGIS